jgi:hypothetical protein
MTGNAAIVEEVDRVSARLLATEAIVMQILTPLLEAVEPGLAGNVINMIRAGLNVPTLNEFQRLASEECLQNFADNVEARIRAKVGAHR